MNSESHCLSSEKCPENTLELPLRAMASSLRERFLFQDSELPWCTSGADAFFNKAIDAIGQVAHDSSNKKQLEPRHIANLMWVLAQQQRTEQLALFADQVGSEPA